MKHAVVTLVLAAFLVPLYAHEASLSKEVLAGFFPEADNFVSRKKVLTPDEVLQIERLAGDQVQEADKELTIYVAVTQDADTQRYRSVGAVLMVDAEGSTGMIDMVVGYLLDGSVRKVMVSENADDKALEDEGFLAQFKGRGPSDGWNPDSDFKLVGDKSSAKAVVLAIRRGMYLLQAIIGSR